MIAPATLRRTETNGETGSRWARGAGCRVQGGTFLKVNLPRRRERALHATNVLQSESQAVNRAVDTMRDEDGCRRICKLAELVHGRTMSNLASTINSK